MKAAKSFSAFITFDAHTLQESRGTVLATRENTLHKEAVGTSDYHYRPMQFVTKGKQPAAKREAYSKITPQTESIG